MAHHSHLFSRDLTLEQQLLLLCLSNYSDGQNICPIADLFYSKKLKCSKRKLNKNIKLVEKLGHLECLEKEHCYRLLF